MPLLGLHHRSPIVLALAALAASPLACVRENPAFDRDEEFAAELSGSGDGDGDGDSGDGDGEPGDGDSGDGDGEPDDSGDGDGDGDSGDGDGDDDTGDGDGDTGDGDGDPIEDLCLMPLPLEDVFPFQTESLSQIYTDNAPNFHLAPENCHLVMFCAATQDFCDPEHPYMAKLYSNGFGYVGESYSEPLALQIQFHPGGGLCEGASLDLDPSQSLSLEIWNGEAFELLPIRLPCLTDYNVPLYIAADGSTFWDIELTSPAALWDAP